MPGRYKSNIALRPSDRLINVWGYGPTRQGDLQPEEFFDRLYSIASGGYSSGYVFLIGESQDVALFKEHVEKSGGDPKRLLSLPQRDDEAAGCSYPFCLASKENAQDLIRIVREGSTLIDGETETNIKGGQVKALVLLYQEAHEEFLPLVLERCPELVVYCVRLCEPDEVGRIHSTGLEPRTDLVGWEGAIPGSVNFEAVEVEAEGPRVIPAEAMFGELAEIARRTGAPLGYAYPALLAAASVHVTGNSNIRANLFVGLVGDVHTGKTVATERTRSLLSLPDGSPLCISTPYSDRGLFQLVPGTEFKKRLLSIDEGRTMMSKGSIENSTLISLLCALWSRNQEGGADRRGAESIHVELSILMNLKVRDESEFPEVFTHATAHGLYDRFLFGVRGEEKWFYKPWDFEASRDALNLNPTIPQVHAEIFEKVCAWVAAGEDRGRLGENALRVAYVTAAAGRLPWVSSEALEAALRFVEWQESIRKVFQPAKGSNEATECMTAVLEAFEKAPGQALNWREICRKKHWYRRFPRSLTATRRTLENDGVIKKDKKTGMHYLNEERNKR